MSNYHEQQDPTECHVVWFDDRSLSVVAAGNAGYLNATSEGGKMYLTDFEVAHGHRRRGIGGALVRTVVEVAQDQGVERILGDVTSRPSLDVMRRHFGEAALNVLVEEDYATDDPDYIPHAVAMLNADVTALQSELPPAA